MKKKNPETLDIVRIETLKKIMINLAKQQGTNAILMVEIEDKNSKKTALSTRIKRLF